MKARLCVAATITLALALQPAAALAWKPYTHNTSAADAYADAVDDGFVTILGREYAVDPALLAALRSWPQFYNAGVIGPDGFPDVTYGQAIIHPSHTGAWLRHVLGRARAAQSDPALSATEKQKILAFSYGFLTHAAGDMWAHTFVNDFARGVFPAVGEILTDADKAGIAVRHLIVEAYVGDATPGYDGFQDADDPRDPRGPAPGGDVSDDSTPAFPYDAPHDFVYRTLVDPAASTPSPERGPIIDFFLDLRSGLEAFVSINPDPIGDAVSAFDDLAADLMALEEDCNFEDFLDGLHDLVACPAALLVLGFDVVIDSFEAFLAFVTGVLEEAALLVLDAYLNAWIDDIDDGLHDWSQLGLATTKGLFDTQTRRDLQNDECGFEPDESTLLRATCEDGVGMLDVVLDASDPFINDHLLSMLGAPDFVGGLREILQTVQEVVDDIIDALGAPLNPVREALLGIKAFIEDLLLDAIAGVLGVDIRTLADFLTHPSRFTCLDNVPLTLPPPLGATTIDLFPPGEHERLDTLLGFVGDAHHVAEPSLPPGCGRLQDAAETQYASLSALGNTVVTAKLLLLDGTELNRLLSEALGRQIDTYAADQNVMVAPLGNADPPDEPWLLSIDSDHAWRSDGHPRFCNEGGPCLGAAEPRPESLNGGAGSFPIWESCVLRPVFPSLFRDWENDPDSFLELEDAVSADPVNDPLASTSTLDRAGISYFDGADTFVAGDNLFTVTAHDAPVGRAFRDDQLGLRRRFYTDPGNPGPWLLVAQGDAFSLGAPDGRYFIDIQSQDPCHGFSGQPEPAEPERTASFILDTTAPLVACATPPFGLEFDTDDVAIVDFAVADGSLGSGVAGQSATVDGFGGLPGVTPTADGASLDLSLFYPGTRTVAVSAADNLGNAGTAACTFELHATPQSMISNVQQALDQGLIRNGGIANSLISKLRAAERMHARGQHSTEHNVLQAFVNELQAQRGKGVDATIADRLIAFALDRIALGR
jgi:hypothetical protein